LGETNKATNACYQRIEKLKSRNFIQPSFTPVLSFTLAKLSFTLG